MFSKELLEDYGDIVKKILVITNDFHLYRALELAKKNNLSVDGVSSKTPLIINLNYLTREYYAVIKSFIFD